MTGWRDFAYPFPDDEFDTLYRVLDILPNSATIGIVFEQLPFFIATVADPKAALYLRLAVENGRPTDEDGQLLVGPDEVWIDFNERTECERLLTECCPSPVVWSTFTQMSFASENAHQNFGRAYTEVTGLPAWAPPKRQSAATTQLTAAR